MTDADLPFSPDERMELLIAEGATLSETHARARAILERHAADPNTSAEDQLRIAPALEQLGGEEERLRNNMLLARVLLERDGEAWRRLVDAAADGSLVRALREAADEERFMDGRGGDGLG